MEDTDELVRSHWTQSGEIEEQSQLLVEHPLYESLTSINKLRVFMENHVYAVWDFMSLLKFLQSRFAPSDWPWLPPAFPTAARFLNEIVLIEESDQGVDGDEFTSHFEMYLAAMEEIGADVAPVKGFVEEIRWSGLAAGMSNRRVPGSAKRFTRQTVNLLERGKTHEVAAAFALGREQAIPQIFRQILTNLSIRREMAPTFHRYLDRHIEVDDETHGPLALELLDILCDGNPGKQTEALAAGRKALENRVRFWGEISDQL